MKTRRKKVGHMSNDSNGVAHFEVKFFEEDPLPFKVASLGSVFWDFSIWSIISIVLASDHFEKRPFWGKPLVLSAGRTGKQGLV